MPLILRVLEFAEENLCFAGDDTAQKDQSDKVRESHQTVENIGAGPDRADGEVWADENGENVDPAVGELLFTALSDQVLQAFFGIVGPAENRGECEEGERNREEVGSETASDRKDAEPSAEGFHGDVYAFESKARIPSARDDDDETCHGADDDRVEEGAGHADKALANRFLGAGRRGGNRGGTEARFVAEDSTGDTFLHRNEHCTDNAARDSGRVKGGADDRFDCSGNMRKVQEQEENANQHIENRHERDDNRGDF